MSDLIYHLFVIVVLVWGILRGYHRKLTGQISSCIGLALGAVCSYVFRYPVEEWIISSIPHIAAGPRGPYVTSTITCASIFAIAYTAFYLVTFPVKYCFRLIDTGILDNVAGAIYGLLSAAVGVSLFCNLFICIFPDCRMMDYARHDDGDIVHEILLLSPWMLGSINVDELSHTLQIEHAHTIS